MLLTAPFFGTCCFFPGAGVFFGATTTTGGNAASEFPDPGSIVDGEGVLCCR
jgi:hypothetical protein